MNVGKLEKGLDRSDLQISPIDPQIVTVLIRAADPTRILSRPAGK